MARFDVYQLASKHTSLVVEVQADALDELATRVVIPLSQAAAAPHAPATRLNPSIDVLGETYILLTPNIASVPRARLGAVVTNIEAEHRDAVTTALDFLFFGF